MLSDIANKLLELVGHSDPLRMPVAENFRRRGKFDEIAFVFPNAASIPITVVSEIPDLPLSILKLMSTLIEFWDEDARVKYHGLLCNCNY